MTHNLGDVFSVPAPAGAHAKKTGAPVKSKIVVRDVHKVFTTKKGAVNVLEGVNLDVRDKEFLAMVGPSGCGRSTLLNCIAAFEPINSGTIEIDGVPVTKPSPKRVFVFQETGILPWLSVWDNIGFGLGK